MVSILLYNCGKMRYTSATMTARKMMIAMNTDKPLASFFPVCLLLFLNSLAERGRKMFFSIDRITGISR